MRIDRKELLIEGLIFVGFITTLCVSAYVFYLLSPSSTKLSMYKIMKRETKVWRHIYKQVRNYMRNLKERLNENDSVPIKYAIKSESRKLKSWVENAIRLIKRVILSLIRAVIYAAKFACILIITSVKSAFQFVHSQWKLICAVLTRQFIKFIVIIVRVFRLLTYFVPITVMKSHQIIDSITMMDNHTVVFDDPK